MGVGPLSSLTLKADVKRGAESELGSPQPPSLDALAKGAVITAALAMGASS